MMASESTFNIQEADPTFARFLDESRFWIQKVLLPIIGIIGLFGNIATILVLSRRGMRTPTNSYLRAIAVADLIYLICVLWLSLRHYSYVNEDPFWSFIYSHVWPYSLYLADATTNTSVWLTVTFAMERCIAIAYPIKTRVICAGSRAKKMITGVYCTCFATTMTTLFEWTAQEKKDPTTNISSTYEIASSELGKMKIYQTIYYWFSSIAFVLLPLSLLILFNSFLIHSLHQSRALRRILTARQTVPEHAKRTASREIKITSTLITVVIVFLFCQLPTAATLIYKISHVAKLTANEEAVLRALGNIFNCLVALNAACNFILYCALSQKYRRTFVSTFFRCLCRRPSSSIHLRTFHPINQQVEGPNGIRFTSGRRSSSSSTRRNNRSLVPLNSAASSSKNKVSTAWPRRMSSVHFSTHHKEDATTPSCIFDHGFSSDILPRCNNLRLGSAVPSDHQSKNSMFKNGEIKRSVDDSSLPICSSWPINIWLFNKSKPVEIPVQESTDSKEFTVTSWSV